MKVLVAVLLFALANCQTRDDFDDIPDCDDITQQDYPIKCRQTFSFEEEDFEEDVKEDDEYSEMKGKGKGKGKGKNWLRDGIVEMISGLDFDSFLDDTGSDLDETIKSQLSLLEQGMCFDTNPKTKCGDGNFFEQMILGCNCVTGFKQQKETCAEIPCRVYTYILENIANMIKRLKKVNSAESLTQFAMDYVYEPLMGILCGCSEEFAESAVNCIKNYDGTLPDTVMGAGSLAAYHEVMGQVDFMDIVERVITKALEVHCVMVDGGECYTEHAQTFVKMMKMADDSFRKDALDDKCGNLKRVKEQFNDFVDTFKQVEDVDRDEYNPYQIGYMVENIIDGWYALSVETWCDEECSYHLTSQFFGTCCAYEAARLASEEGEQGLWYDVYDLIKKVFKFVSPYVAMEELEFPVIERCVLRKIVKSQNPLKMCLINKSHADYSETEQMCSDPELY